MDASGPAREYCSIAENMSKKDCVCVAQERAAWEKYQQVIRPVQRHNAQMTSAYTEALGTWTREYDDIMAASTTVVKSGPIPSFIKCCAEPNSENCDPVCGAQFGGDAVSIGGADQPEKWNPRKAEGDTGMGSGFEAAFGVGSRRCSDQAVKISRFRICHPMSTMQAVVFRQIALVATGTHQMCIKRTSATNHTTTPR